MRDAGRVADDEAEARARHARCALHVEAADLGVLARLGKCGRLADATQLLGVVLRVAVGCRLDAAGSEPARARRRAAASAAASSSSASLSSAFTGRSASSSSGVGLPSSFIRPRSSSTARDRARASARRRRAARRTSAAAPLRASAARQPSGSLRAALRSITSGSLETFEPDYSLLIGRIRMSVTSAVRGAASAPALKIAGEHVGVRARIHRVNKVAAKEGLA